MNFLPAELKPHDAGLAVHVTPEIVLPVPPSRREAYAPYAGRPIELGSGGTLSGAVAERTL